MKTDQGWVIEFQHSYIKPEERQSRDAFYEKLVWVVDATRRKRDAKQFSEALSTGTQLSAEPMLVEVRSDECALLREWTASRAPVFFDFGIEQPLTWCVAGHPDGRAYVGPVSHANFIKLHRDGAVQPAGDFDELVKNVHELVAMYESYRKAQAWKGGSLQPFDAFGRHSARRGRDRRRL